ncbi:MAG: NAD(P)-dependent oxidoreductase [Chloroflexi bacterium]|nr:NAD(P)-dependent oxidoreductase [Chloroflexota bacterium]MCL5273300.1 NAD(P)-dependent oxidoreductase [Chloroflexota bacterium]
MKIMVTGGAGQVGRGVVARLVNNGHDVRAVDLHTDKDRIAGAQYAECDITRYDDAREQVRGMDAIIHLAAHAHPAAATGVEIFRVNCAGTYNIFEAAAQEGIRRVSVASSINALGYNFGVKSFPIVYFPMDEAHPTLATGPYSFSKQTTESIAEYYWQRDGISGACLRMPSVFSLNGRFPWMKQMVAAQQHVMNELLSFPPQKQREWLDKINARLAESRQGRVFEIPWEKRMRRNFSEPDPIFLAGFGYTDFWSVIDVDDAAQAFEKSLLADFEGSHALFVSQRENSVGAESEALARLFYPQATARKRAIAGKAALLSYDCAAALIGYEPQIIVRDRVA